VDDGRRDHRVTDGDRYLIQRIDHVAHRRNRNLVGFRSLAACENPQDSDVWDVSPVSPGDPVSARFAALAFAALMCALVPTSSSSAAPSSGFNEVTSAPIQPSLVPDDYQIGPQDTLEVAVFQVADLSKTVRVDSGGTILLPLIGQVTASGRTTKELSDDVAAELGRKYLNDPLVTVTVKESASQRVTVDGAVINPGIYPISGQTTLMQAVALAQGPAELADLRQVAIFRNNGAQRLTAVFDLAAIRSGEAADPRILANDVVIVETSRGRKFLRGLRDMIPLFQMLLFF
jgi:polysaccharide biosynthesis/export protein